MQVPHSFAADGLVRYGDSVMLQVTQTGPDGEAIPSFLSNNIWDRVDFDKNTISVTAGPASGPVARNTFVVTRPVVKPVAAVRACCECVCVRVRNTAWVPVCA